MLNPQNIRGPGEAMFAVLMFLFALLAASYPIVRIIGWWIEGAVEPVLAIASIGLYFGLIVVVVTMPEPVALAALLAILTSAVVTPILGRSRDQAELKRIEEERLQQYAAALERNPLDPVARIALAEALYRKGDVDQAIEHLQWTLQQFPRLAFRIRPELDEWVHRREQMQAGATVCTLCNIENPPGLRWCRECGAELAERARERVPDTSRLHHPGRLVVRIWILGATVLLLFIGAYYWLPSAAAGPVTFVFVMAGVWCFYRWSVGDAQR